MKGKQVTPNIVIQQIERRVFVVDGTCDICEKPFVGTVRRRLCSNACAQRARYRRNAEKLRAAARERYAARKEAQQAEQSSASAPKNDLEQRISYPRITSGDQ